MKVKFSKMHGCGNDFVVVDARKIASQDWKKLSPKLLDRRFGVGADQLLVLLPSKSADVEMKIFERDGIETEMCGNGIRCVGRYLFEHGLEKREYKIATLGGTKVIGYESWDKVTVDMGKPTLGEPFRRELNLSGRTLQLHIVSMGNPHAVFFLHSENELEWVTDIGPKLEHHEWFPNRTNVEFVFPKTHTDLTVRVWERGAGETYACGTGACAAAVAAIETGKARSPVQIHFKGGTLTINWKKGESVFMTGPAVQVYEGEIEI
jgi:diaminopimelate epimerase